MLYSSSVRKDGWGNLQKSSSAVSCREECRGDDDTTMILTVLYTNTENCQASLSPLISTHHNLIL